METDLNIGSLDRYNFVPIWTIGEFTKSHLLALLYQKKMFHTNIQYFVVQGLQNIHHPQFLQHARPNDQKLPVTATIVNESPMDIEESTQEAPQEKTSLRYYLYQVFEPSDNTMINAV